MKPAALALPLALALAACQTDVPPPVFDPAPRCGADRLQGLVGQDAAVLRGMSFDGPVRVIHPGMAVTMDYNPTRLNIEVDAEGVIRRVWCA